MNSLSKKILLFESGDELEEKIISEFFEAGYLFEKVKTNEKVVEKITEKTYNLLLIAIKLPDIAVEELLVKIKKIQSLLPVIIISPPISKDTLVRLIRMGVANVYEQPFITGDMIAYTDSLLSLFQQINRHDFQIVPFTDVYKKKMVLKSKEKILELVPKFLIKDLVELGYCNEDESLPLSTAIIETLSNSLYHGNFGIESRVRDIGTFASQKEFKRLVSDKEKDPAYSSKEIIVSCECDKTTIKVTIEDEGKGFNWRKKNKIDDNLKSSSGKGLFLIKALVDEVNYNDKGNRVILTKYRDKKLLSNRKKI